MWGTRTIEIMVIGVLAVIIHLLFLFFVVVLVFCPTLADASTEPH